MLENTKRLTYGLLEVTIRRMNSKNDDSLKLELVADSRKKYEKYFDDLNQFILKNCMKPEVKCLDRHKIAGIIIASIIESDIVKHDAEIKDGFFFGEYAVAASVGFDYLQYSLKALLKKNNLKTIERFAYPEVLSCETSYFEIFARNIYYGKELFENKINPLDIAEKLFLLENITLKEYGINPARLKTGAEEPVE